jgi:hypothetical protein
MKGWKVERIFWGLFFIVAAAVLIINQLGIFEELGQVNIIHLFLAAVFAVCGVRSLIHYNIPGALFSLAFILILYAEPLGIAAISPWTILLAALLGSIGFSIIFRKKKPWYEYHHHKCDYDEHFDTIDQTDADIVDMNTSFGSSIKYVNSNNFQRANMHCSFGAMKVYFDHCAIQNNVAELRMDVSFAGVELFIPKEWRVEQNVDFSVGGMDEKNRNVSTGSPVLRLTGNVKFGGVTIIYV